MKTKQKIYLTLIIFILIVIGLLVFLINPLVDKVKLSSVEFRKKSDLSASYKEKGGNYLEELRDKHTSLEPDILEVNESFVDSERAVDFILAVEQAAALTNNYQEIKEISSAEEGALSFRVSLWGSFPNLIKFLAQLENMDYFIDFDSLQTGRIGERDLKTLIDKGIVVSIGDVKSVVEINAYTK